MALPQQPFAAPAMVPLHAEPVALLPSSMGGLCDNHLRIKRLEEQVSQLVQEQRQQHRDKSRGTQPKSATDLDATVARGEVREDQGKGEQAHARDLAQAKDELESKAHECEKLKEAKDKLEEDLKTMSADYQAVQKALQEVSTAKADLEGQLKSLGSEKQTSEDRVAAAAEAARKLRSERAELEAALEKSLMETRDLRCRAAIAEDQANKAEDRARKAETECQQWQKKAEQCRDELSVLQRKYAEQTGFLLELEGQIWREQQAFGAAPGQAPGDRMKASRDAADAMLVKEHGMLKKELMKTRCDVDLAVQKIRDQRHEIQQLRARQ